MALDIDDFKGDLEAIGREFLNDTFPPAVQAKVKGWTKDIRENVIRAAAAKAIGDQQDLDYATRELGLFVKAAKGMAAATAVRGVVAKDEAMERLAGIALGILVKGALAAL